MTAFEPAIRTHVATGPCPECFCRPGGIEHIPQEEISPGEGGNFLCFVKGQDAKSIHKYLIQLAKNIHEITKIDGYDCTLYLRYSTAWCSESKNLDGMLHLLMERLNDQKL